MRTQAIPDCRYCPDPNRVAATSGTMFVNVLAVLALMIPITAIDIPKPMRVPIPDPWFVPPDEPVVVQPLPVPPVRPRERIRVEPVVPVKPVAPVVTEEPSTGPVLPKGIETSEFVAKPDVPVATPVDNGIACIVCPRPPYPRNELIRGIQGETLVRIWISREGVPAQVKVERSSGSPNLDRAALDAVRKWRFAPAIRAGGAVEVEATVPVRFSILSG